MSETFAEQQARARAEASASRRASTLMSALGVRDPGAEACYCNAVEMPPCGWCSNHNPECEWPDADCDCYEVVVEAIHRPAYPATLGR
jgi:hypothetical protein